jgi:hypothetical protein
MAQTQSKTQLPVGMLQQSNGHDEGTRAFERGLEMGRQYAEQAIRRIAAWAEENPGQLLLAGAAAGFLLGTLLFRPRRVHHDAR